MVRTQTLLGLQRNQQSICQKLAEEVRIFQTLNPECTNYNAKAQIFRENPSLILKLI